MIFLLILVLPIAYASIEVGGGFGVRIIVGENSTNTTDDNIGEEAELTTELYFHSYAKAADIEKREENYAFTGEEIYFEIYVQNKEETDEVILELADKEIECKEKRSKLDNGDDLGEEFSGQAGYDDAIMRYYECSFISDESFKGEEEIRLTALADDEVLAEETEEWIFNPELTVEIGKDLDASYVKNTNDITLSVKDSCGNDINAIEPNEKKESHLINCKNGFIIGRFI